MKKLKTVVAGLLLSVSLALAAPVSAAEAVPAASAKEASKNESPKKENASQVEIRKKGNKYYGYVNGEKVTYQWLTYEGNRYYIGSKGYACTSSANVDGKAWVFTSRGKLVKPEKKRLVNRAGYTWYVDTNGQAETGWFYIGEKLYRADPKGRVYKNRIYQGVTFGANGVAVQDTAAKLKLEALKVTENIFKSGMSKSQKLKTAWNYLVYSGKFGYRSMSPNIYKKGWQNEFAYNMLKNRRGSCSSFACAFAALASEAGYKPTIYYGRVPGSRDGAPDGMTRHCWVKIDGRYYDPEAQFAGWLRGVYGTSSFPIYHTVTKTVKFYDWQ